MAPFLKQKHHNKMANCTEWQEMDSRDRIQVTGKLLHLLMNDSDSFTALTSMVRSAECNGQFEDVKILPETNNDNG